jgi:hypothetical protein
MYKIYITISHCVLWYHDSIIDDQTIYPCQKYSQLVENKEIFFSYIEIEHESHNDTWEKRFGFLLVIEEC